jgi:hypothetical protein
MAGNGPIPKDPSKRVRRNSAATSEIVLSRSDRAPDAPALRDAEGFSERTRTWFETWRSSPQGTQFLATDWQRLRMLAYLVDRYFAEPTAALMAEIRLSEGAVGATVADRRRLLWRIDDSPEAPATRKRRARDPRLTVVPDA